MEDDATQARDDQPISELGLGLMADVRRLCPPVKNGIRAYGIVGREFFKDPDGAIRAIQSIASTRLLRINAFRPTTIVIGRRIVVGPAGAGPWKSASIPGANLAGVEKALVLGCRISVYANPPEGTITVAIGEDMHVLPGQWKIDTDWIDRELAACS
ncbi:hypothetical protein LCGC14_0736400 [marine sediment metagenome]|uniref:Uncharacterized protein n=1 Tax=marine sediment metagenome TaxID=412755 RepID=A0A0F9QSX8_9ZZZZ